VFASVAPLAFSLVRPSITASLPGPRMSTRAICLTIKALAATQLSPGRSRKSSDGHGERKTPAKNSRSRVKLNGR